MAGLAWQDAAVAAVAALALAWLVRRRLRRRRLPAPMCDDCPACAARTATRRPAPARGVRLVSVSELTRRED